MSDMGALMRRFGGRCWWCRREVRRVPSGHIGRLAPDHATRDHLFLASCGGGDAASNLVLACHRCNDARGAMSQVAWARHVLARGADLPTSAPPEVTPS